MTDKTYSNRSNAIAGARAELAKQGVERAVDGVHFVTAATDDGRFTWNKLDATAKTPEATVCPPAAAKGAKKPSAPPDRLIRNDGTVGDVSDPTGLVAAKTAAGHPVMTDPNSPLLVDGIVHPNKARAKEARRMAEQAAAGEATPEQRAARIARAGKKAATLATAQSGVIPPQPVFSPKIAGKYQGEFDAIAALAKIGDVEGLRTLKQPNGQPYAADMKHKRRRSIAKYRDLVVVALEAKAAA